MRQLLFATTLAVLAVPAAAQEPPARGQHREGMGQGMGQGMMGGGILRPVLTFAPDALLKHAEHLKLTSDQVSQLTALKEESEKAVQQAHEPARAAHMSLNQALKETPDDTTAIRGYFRAHQEAESNMQWLRASAAFRARALLTADQRKMIESMGAEPGKHNH